MEAGWINMRNNLRGSGGSRWNWWRIYGLIVAVVGAVGLWILVVCMALALR